MEDDQEAPARHAVVLGASIAGLLAARVLADRFDRVTVLERDSAAHTRGAPQGRHLHGLMERGRQVIEELFPGLTAEAVEAGAPTTEVLVGSRWYLSGLRAHPTPTGLTTLLASRPLLENLIRTRVAALPGMEVRPDVTACGLVADEGGSITGVRVRDGGTFRAGLVVDATGRGSRAPAWLAAAGHQRPAEDRVGIDLGYASRMYQREPGQLDGDLGVVVSTMPGRRGGGAIAVEGGRWHVTLGGMLGDHPPTDHDGFEAFAATLPVPDVHQLIRESVPVDDATPYRFRESVRCRYERLPSPPGGFLAIGDAVCSFNPLYAQGMTVAAQQALALRDCLAETGPDATLPARYYRRMSAPTDVAWQMSTNTDLAYPGVAGRRTLRCRAVNAYVHRAHRAAHADPVVARAFMRLANLVEAPGVLLTVPMMMRVAWAGIRSR